MTYLFSPSRSKSIVYQLGQTTELYHRQDFTTSSAVVPVSTTISKSYGSFSYNNILTSFYYLMYKRASSV